jgi:hypothetical protein
MAKRRTVQQINDMLRRVVKPGDIIAVATNGKYGDSSALRLVLLQHIYLDDSKGETYYTFPTCFRDTSTGLLYAHPTDREYETGPVDNPPFTLDDPSRFIPIKPQKYQGGWDYDGLNEVVGVQDYRLVGQPIDTHGKADGKVSTYKPSNFILVEGVTQESLQK